MMRNALIALLVALSVSGAWADKLKTVNIFDEVVFYDGYRQEVVDRDLDDGILRFKNSLYSVKIDPSQINDMGDDLQMDVLIGALCDNYDRIGNVSLAFVPKGSAKYVFDEVRRIEVTRFITPFMNKNKEPREVPYHYEIANIGRILRDADINSKYDFWLEFEVFGVPYAANTQVSGCSDRNDVFEGTIDLSYTPADPAVKETGNIIVPIFTKLPEDHGNINFNNYTEAATDTLGVTTRTFEFEIPEDVADSRVYLIMTNHGAGRNGEEYVRRLHLVYYDGEIMLSYTPGGVSCEPYRKYNTQANGIYGLSKKTDEQWAAVSNWCPGQAVPIREIHLGAQKAGKHKVMIRVPDAVFAGNDGDFRPSLYFHGVREGELKAGVDQIWFDAPEINYTIIDGIMSFNTEERIREIRVHSFDGCEIKSFMDPAYRIDLSSISSDMYLITFFTEDGRTLTVKTFL